MSVEEIISRGLIFIVIYFFCGSILGGKLVSVMKGQKTEKLLFIRRCVVAWPIVLFTTLGMFIADFYTKGDKNEN